MVVDVIGGGCVVCTHVATCEDLRRQPQAVLIFFV